jgi:hypothetical protein
MSSSLYYIVKLRETVLGLLCGNLEKKIDVKPLLESLSNLGPHMGYSKGSPYCAHNKVTILQVMSVYWACSSTAMKNVPV